MASIWIDHQVGPREWPLIEEWLEEARARSLDPMPILGPGEVLFIARRFEGTTGQAIGAATVRMMSDGDAEVMLGGGNKAAAKPIFDAACMWARAQGANGIVAQGRRGWGRLLGFPVCGEVGGETCFRLEF